MKFTIILAIISMGLAAFPLTDSFQHLPTLEKWAFAVGLLLSIVSTAAQFMAEYRQD